jgi:thymidylate synthase (FAD)
MKIAPMEVTLLNHMGSDLTVVNAARVSFAKEHKEFESGDHGLVRYLAEHNHWTPFGHCFAQFRIKAPIFVARQLVKHQVGLVWNEVSRRYVDSEPEFWFPEVWRGRPEGSMKQGSSGEIQLAYDAEYMPEAAVERCLQIYLGMIADGVAPEQARMVLPQNMMTEWYWSGSLAAFARVCNLRLDTHAQAETSQVASGIDHHMTLLFPVSWGALVK